MIFRTERMSCLWKWLHFHFPAGQCSSMCESGYLRPGWSPSYPAAARISPSCDRAARQFTFLPCRRTGMLGGRAAQGVMQGLRAWWCLFGITWWIHNNLCICCYLYLPPVHISPWLSDPGLWQAACFSGLFAIYYKSTIELARRKLFILWGLWLTWYF